MSKKLHRLMSIIRPATPGRRRYVRRHVARKAERDFRSIVIAVLVIGTFFNLVNVLSAALQDRVAKNKPFVARDGNRARYPSNFGSPPDSAESRFLAKRNTQVSE